MRCPYCKERIKRKALICKHCHADLTKSPEEQRKQDDEGTMRYLQNGFNKVNSELDKLEEKVEAKTGILMFTTHTYSEDDLMMHASRIESFIEKIRSDLEMWNSSRPLSDRIQFAYSEYAEESSDRLNDVSCRIQERTPTIWERVGGFFKMIASKLLPLFSFRLIAGKPKSHFLPNLGGMKKAA
jgi:hypothetical protein